MEKALETTEKGFVNLTQMDLVRILYMLLALDELNSNNGGEEWCSGFAFSLLLLVQIINDHVVMLENRAF